MNKDLWLEIENNKRKFNVHAYLRREENYIVVVFEEMIDGSYSNKAYCHTFKSEYRKDIARYLIHNIWDYCNHIFNSWNVENRQASFMIHKLNELGMKEINFMEYVEICKIKKYLIKKDIKIGKPIWVTEEEMQDMIDYDNLTPLEKKQQFLEYLYNDLKKYQDNDECIEGTKKMIEFTKEAIKRLEVKKK